MGREKEAIHCYYEDKGDERLIRQDNIWHAIDKQWNNTLHPLIHAACLYLNSTFSYACGFRFDVEVMDGFFQCD